jgi:hypothetical protein
VKKIKDWLINTFLPVWAKQSILAENAQLKAENARLRAKLRELGAYTDGLEAGIRAQRRIVINNNREVSK